MPFEELLFPVLIPLVIGFSWDFIYVKAQIIAIEDKFRAERERWKVEAAGEIKKDVSGPFPLHTQRKDRRRAYPVLPDFLFNPVDARFISSPVDYIIFDGPTEVSDEKKQSIRIVFMDVKKGSGSL